MRAALSAVSSRSRPVLEALVIGGLLLYGLRHERVSGGIQLRYLALAVLLVGPLIRRAFVLRGEVAPSPVAAKVLELVASAGGAFFYPVPRWALLFAGVASAIHAWPSRDIDGRGTIRFGAAFVAVLCVVSVSPLAIESFSTVAIWTVYLIALLAAESFGTSVSWSALTLCRRSAALTCAAAGAILVTSVQFDGSDSLLNIPDPGPALLLVPALLTVRSLVHQASVAGSEGRRAFMILTVTLFGLSCIHEPFVVLRNRDALLIGVDAEVDNARSLQLYVDGGPLPCISLAANGSRRVHWFTPSRPMVQTLGLAVDPLDSESPARVCLFKLIVQRRGETLRELTGGRWEKWDVFPGVAVGPVESRGCVSFRIPSARFFLGTYKDPLDDGLTSFERLVFAVAPSAPTAATYVAFALVLIFLMTTVRGDVLALPILLVSIGTIGWIVGIALLRSRWTNSGLGMPPPIRAAVGQASYLGYPKSLEVYTYALSVGFAVLSGAVAGRLLRPHVESLSERDAQPGSGARWKVVVVLVMALVLFRWPDLRGALDRLASAHHSLGYDGSNLLTWSFLSIKGAVPMRDYWFPYSGFANSLGPFPWGLFRAYVQSTVVWAGLAVGAHQVAGASGRWSLALVAAMALSIAGEFVTNFDRYGIALDVVLLFFALLQPRRPYLSSVLYGAFLAWAMAYELTQVVYALPSIGLIAIFDLIAKSPVERRRSGVRYAVAALTFAMLAAIQLAVLASHGQLRPFYEFHRDLGDVAAYVSSQTEMAYAWYTFLPLRGYATFANVLLLGNLMLLAYGVMRTLKGPRTTSSVAVLALAVLACIMFMKQIARPYITAQLTAVPLIGFLLVVKDWSRTWNRCQWLVAAIVALRVALLFIEDGTATSIVKNHLLAPLDIPGGLATLARCPDRLEGPAKSYFRDEAFLDPNGENAAVVSYVRTLRERREEKIFVLGDEAYLYIIKDQLPPRFQTIYNSSPIWAQNEVIAWLDRDRPKFVIWNSWARTFDGVPNVVRIPIIFDYVIQHYVPAQSLGSGVEVLVRTESGVPVAFDFWLPRLGPRIDMRRLPAYSNAATLHDAAEPRAPGVHDVLEVTASEAVAAAEDEHSVAIDVAGHELYVDFRAVRHRSLYRIDLDRVWFWSAAKAAGLEPRLAAVQPDSALSFKWTYKQSDSHLLY